jgi:GNAT superfamily N-acetyltransferase
MAGGVSDQELIRRGRHGQAAAYRIMAQGHRDSSVVIPGPGVQAVVVPATPDRSLPNSVTYLDPAAVIAHYDELAAAYDRAGVRAWTVWVHPGDDELVAELEQRGHALDGTPAVMGAEIAELDLEQRVALDLDPDPSWAVSGALNDAAYGLPPGALGVMLVDLTPEQMPLYVARLDGVPVACAGFVVEGGDCAAEFVATLPEARGHGLGGELMREGLRRARDAGATTATLEASAMGQPVYERLGYRVLGTMRMLERRAS